MFEGLTCDIGNMLLMKRGYKPQYISVRVILICLCCEQMASMVVDNENHVLIDSKGLVTNYGEGGGLQNGRGGT